MSPRIAIVERDRPCRVPVTGPHSLGGSDPAHVRRDQPNLSIEWVRANVPYQTQALMDRFVDGLRKAGLS